MERREFLKKLFRGIAVAPFVPAVLAAKEADALPAVVHFSRGRAERVPCSDYVPKEIYFSRRLQDELKPNGIVKAAEGAYWA